MLYHLIVFHLFYRYSFIIGALINKVSKTRLQTRDLSNSSTNKAQNQRIKIINLIDIVSWLDKKFNKLYNTSNRAQFRVTVLKIWQKQDADFFPEHHRPRLARIPRLARPAISEFFKKG